MDLCVKNNSPKSKDKWEKNNITAKTRKNNDYSSENTTWWQSFPPHAQQMKLLHSYLSCSLQYRTQMSWNDECSLQSHHWTQPLTHAGFRRRYCLYDGELWRGGGAGVAEGLEDLGMQVTWLAVGVGCGEGAGWTGVTSGGCGGDIRTGGVNDRHFRGGVIFTLQNVTCFCFDWSLHWYLYRPTSRERGFLIHDTLSELLETNTSWVWQFPVSYSSLSFLLYQKLWMVAEWRFLKVILFSLWQQLVVLWNLGKRNNRLDFGSAHIGFQIRIFARLVKNQ